MPLPRPVKSSTLMDEPNRPIPKMLTALPHRAKFRRDNELPKPTKSSTDTDDPKRDRLNTARFDPSRPMDRSAKAEPRVV
jgi:hypothetical protein